MGVKASSIIAVLTRAIVVIILISVAIGMYTLLFITRPKPEVTDQAAALQSVVVFPMMQVQVQRQWTGFGTVRALNSADVPARVTATVERISPEAQEGNSVEQGTLLVVLDDSDFVRQVEIAEETIADLSAQLERTQTEEANWRARLELADEAVELAQRQYDRVLLALQADAARQREVDQARQALITAMRDQVTTRDSLAGIGPRRAGIEAQIQVQRAQQKLATQNVQRCSIVAPISGVLELVDVEQGENVAAGSRIARIVNLDQLEVPVQLPAGARPFLQRGGSILLHAAGRDDHAYAGVIERISPSDDESTRTLIAYVVIDQPRSVGTARFAPGMFLSALASSELEQPVQVVPRRAIRNDRVRIVVNGMIEDRPVTGAFDIRQSLPETGLEDMEWRVLASPLPADSLVVVDGGRRLAAGMRVEPILSTRVTVSSGVEQ